MTDESVRRRRPVGHQGEPARIPLAPSRPARTIPAALVIGAAVILLLGLGAAAALHLRKGEIAARGLTEGRAALADGNWKAACTHLRKYLSRHPKDIGVLKDYARAQLLVRPLEMERIGAAIQAYRQVLREAPRDDLAFGRLVALYSDLRNFSEAIYIARSRLAHQPDDPKAGLWLAKGLASQQKVKEAREVLLRLIQVLEERSERFPEYVEACWLIGTLDAQSKSSRATTQAFGWLDRAVEYDPKSPIALLNRARVRRSARATDGQEREAAMAAARADLERTDALAPADPRVRLLLCEEWTECGDLDQAMAELDALKQVDRGKLEEHFPDPTDWAVARFLVAANLALRKRATSEGIALADQVVTVLKSKRQRVLVLPFAIELYLAGQKVAQAKGCLNEYLDSLSAEDSILRSNERATYLSAIVAQSEGEPYRVIELLETLGEGRPSLPPVLWKLLANAYSRTGQTRRAMSAIKQCLRLEPLDRHMTMRLAQEYIRQRDWSRAIKTARLAESLDPTDITIKLLRIGAGISVALGQPGTASNPQVEDLMKELAALRSTHPDHAEIPILRAAYASSRGRTDEAERELKLAIEECSETLDAELHLAQLYLNSDRKADAIETLRSACKRHGELARPWQALCQVQYANRQYDEAHATLRAGVKAVSSKWDRQELVFKLAMLEILHLDRKSGVDRLRNSAGNDRYGVRARTLLLSLPEVRRDLAKAQKLIDEIRKIEGEVGLLWRSHQASLWLSGDDWHGRREDIASALQRCIDGDPGWSTPVLLLGGMHERLGAVDRAEEVYRRALSVSPDATDVIARLVTLLERHRRFAEAAEALGHLEASSWKSTTRGVREGILSGDHARAIDELKLRIANGERGVDSLLLLARLVYRQGKNADLALRHLDEAAKVAPDSMAVAAARVSILKTEKRLGEARRILDEKANEKGTFEAHLLRASFLTDIGESALAEKAYKRLPALSKRGEGYEVLGRFYASSNRLDDAIGVWDKGSSAFPESLPLKRSLMTALLERGGEADRDRALQLLSELEGRLPDDPDLLAIRGGLLLKEGTEDAVGRARQLLQRIVQLRPRAVDAHLKLIRIAMREREYDAARDLAIRAQGANPSSTRLLLARGRAERALDNFRMAGESAHAALLEDPNNPEAYKLLAGAAIDSRNPKAITESLALLNKAIKNNPRAERLQSTNAMLLNALGKTDEAIAKLEAFTQSTHGRRSIKTLLTLAELYHKRGDLENCGKRIEAAATLAPDHSSVLCARISYLSVQKKFDEIVALVSAHRDKHSKDAPFLISAASALASSGKKPYLRRAMALFEQAIATAPQLTEAHFALAALAYHMGNVGRAEEIYRELLDKNPNNPQALNGLAWVMAEARNDYKAALKLADKGVQLAPESRSLRDTRGVILSNLPGRLEDAREDLQKCVELTAPDSKRRAKALFRLGGVCARLKDFPRAKQHLSGALRIDSATPALTPAERSEIDRFLRDLPDKPA